MAQRLNFWAIYNTVGGWEWDKCHYPTRLDTYWLSKIKKPQISVCEDVKSHYDYRNQNLNYNPKDCCNLRNSPIK